MEPQSPIHPVERHPQNSRSLIQRYPSRFRQGFSSEDQKLTIQTRTEPSKSETMDTQSNLIKKPSFSPSHSPNSISTGHNAPRIELKKLKTGFLDDDAVYDSLDKFSGMIKYQQLEKEKYSPLYSEQTDDTEQSPVAKRNQELVKLIQRYQVEKGMAMKSKESKFEARLKSFKGLKTFVSIPDTIKSLSDPLKSMASLKMHSESTKAKSVLNTMKDISKTPSHLQGERVPKDYNPSPKFQPENGWPSALDISRKKPLNLEEKIQQISSDKEQPYTHSMRQQLQENIKKHMGLEAYESIQTELSNPAKQREIQERAKVDMKKMRQTKEKLQNDDLFHSLIDHLAVQTKPHAINTVEEEERADSSPFIQKFERELHATNIKPKKVVAVDADEQREVLKAEKEEYKQNLLQKLQNSALLGKPESPKKERLDNSNKGVEELEPDAKAAFLLNSFQHRSSQMIKLLKKKANGIHQSTLGTNRSNRTESRDSRSKISQFETLETLGNNGVAGYEDGKSFNLPTLVDKPQPKNSILVLGNIHSESSFPPSQALLNGLDEASMSYKKVEHRRKAGQRSYKQSMDCNMSHKIEETEPNSMMAGVNSLAKRCCVRKRQRTELIRGGKGHLSYEKSLEDIQGMISNLSVTNKQIGSELKGTMKDVEKFYNSKLNYMKTIELPESLNEPANHTTKKSTGLIMRFASKVMRDQIL